MASLPADKTYELWVIPANGSAPIPAGTFTPDATGNASVVMPPMPEGIPAKAFGVTIEKAGGSSTPTAPILMAGAAPATANRTCLIRTGRSVKESRVPHVPILGHGILNAPQTSGAHPGVRARLKPQGAQAQVGPTAGGPRPYRGWVGYHEQPLRASILHAPQGRRPICLTRTSETPHQDQSAP